MKKKIIIGSAIFVFCILFLYSILSMPFSKKEDNIQCEYNSISHQILCTQTGDEVPEWLDIEPGKVLGINPEYTMELIFKKSGSNYITMSMIDKIFIQGLNRKIIYSQDNKHLSDFIKFKFYAINSDIGNWGSIILYCSENNLKEDVCKNMKKRHR